MTQALFMGVDGGATRTRARLRDADGRALGEGTAGAGNALLKQAAYDAVLKACRAAAEDAGLGESDLGRVPSIRFGPRLVDLDILYYEDKIVNDAKLRIPHPRISERDFVLRPMLEIAPDFKHPETGETTADMVKALDLRK